MNIQKKLITFSLIAIASILTLILIRTSEPEIASSNQKAIDNFDSKKAQSSNDVLEEVQKNENSTKDIAVIFEKQNGTLPPNLTQDDFEKAILRKREQGYFSASDIVEYQNHSREILRALADEGDLKAMHVLLIQFSGEQDIEMFDKYARKAAVYGSTAVYDILATINDTHSTEIHSDRPEVKASIIESQAWYMVGIIRGDHAYLEIAKERLENAGRTLSQEDKQQILTRARQLYSELEHERQELGLPKFDNSIPEYAARYHAYQQWLKNQ